MCTDFGSSCSRRSRVLNYFFNTFLHNSAPYGCGIIYAYSFLCGLQVICVPILVQVALGVSEFRIIFLTLSFIIPHLTVVGLCYAYSFLCGLQVICVHSLVQIPPGVPEFRNISSTLSFITPLLRLLGLRYAYSFLCGLQVICVHSLVQISPGSQEF